MESDSRLWAAAVSTPVFVYMSENQPCYKYVELVVHLPIDVETYFKKTLKKVLRLSAVSFLSLMSMQIYGHFLMLDIKHKCVNDTESNCDPQTWALTLRSVTLGENCSHQALSVVLCNTLIATHQLQEATYSCLWNISMHSSCLPHTSLPRASPSSSPLQTSEALTAWCLEPKLLDPISTWYQHVIH